MQIVQSPIKDKSQMLVGVSGFLYSVKWAWVYRGFSVITPMLDSTIMEPTNPGSNMSAYSKIVAGILLHWHWMGLCGHSDITHRVFTGIWFISTHTTLKLSSFGYESTNHKVSLHIHGPKSEQNENCCPDWKGWGAHKKASDMTLMMAKMFQIL